MTFAMTVSPSAGRRCVLFAAATVLCLNSTARVASAAEPEAPSDWKVSIGPGIYVFPEFPGSSRLKLLPLPVQDISWRDRVFSQGPDVLGVNALRGENYHAGASLSFDFQSRNASDDPRLKGLPDVHYGPKLRLFADYTWWAFTGSANLYQDIAGTGQGLTAMVDLVASAPWGAFLFSVGPGVTWASGRYNSTFFGVTPQQSAASGLPAYAARSGLRDVHLNIDASYQIAPHWSANVVAVIGRLGKVAAGSPIPERMLDFNAMASVLYRF